MLSPLERWLLAFGIDWRGAYTSLKGVRRFWSGYRQLKAANRAEGGRWKFQASYPCLRDFYGESGLAHGHYFHQDLHVAQRIFQKAPLRHVDVGSRIDGFVAHVASFRKVEVLDWRELDSKVPNIAFRQCDLLNVPPHFLECCDSLSCLHVLEHIGLGRYGDPFHFTGYVKALTNLVKMLQPGGTLYLSTPFGFPRIEYNAHRVFHLETIKDLVEQSLEIIEFSMVDDAGDLHRDADVRLVAKASPQFRFALAIFELRKPN